MPSQPPRQPLQWHNGQSGLRFHTYPHSSTTTPHHTIRTQQGTGRHSTAQHTTAHHSCKLYMLKVLEAAIGAEVTAAVASVRLAVTLA